MERFRGKICGIENCRSRNYYRESGLVYCSEGHRQPDGFTVEQSQDEFGSQGRKTRRKTEEKEKVYQHYSGHKAFELYLQCYQLILWKQCYWLVHTKRFPAELELIVHDLWVLRLQNLRFKVETATNDDDAGSQIFSSQPNADTDTENEGQARSTRGRTPDSTPKLIDTLALCYLGLLLLRLPVSVGDVHRWARNGDIIYLRAIKEIPATMKQRLPPPYHEALAPNALLQPDNLHNAVQQIAITYQSDFGMTLPPLNYPLMLFRYIKELAMPIDLYPAVQRLSKLLSYNFDFSALSKNHIRISDLPEPQLVSLLIVAVKLAYPFDGIRRYPLTSTEPAALVVDWSSWTEAISEFEREHEDGPCLAEKDAFELKEENVYSLSETQLDEYMSFYEKYWVDEQGAEQGLGSELRQALFRMFPTGGSGGVGAASKSSIAHQQSLHEENRELEKLKAIQRSLRAQKSISEEEAEAREDTVLRPGSQYKHYRKESELPEHARAFYEAAAELTGLSLSSIIIAVFQTEMRFQKWTASQRKKVLDGQTLSRLNSEHNEGAQEVLLGT